VNGIDWYAARAAGVVAYCLLTSGVLLGVLLAGRARLPRWPQFAVTDVHRFVALLTGAFVVLHVFALLLDRYVHTSLLAVLVPGASSYRPFWVALGTVALELLAAVGISNLLRKRLGHSRWRRIHYLTFAVWAAATAHGIGAGTDAGAEWLRLLYVVSIGSVAAALAWRAGRSAAGAPARS
jgi:sulfoxide reductase heme-binding subunit YedZ